MTELELDDVVNTRPMGIIGGRIGVGKTYEAARAFNSWRWLVTNRTGLAPFGRRLVKAREKGKWEEYVFPKAKFVLEKNLKAGGGAAKWFKSWISKWCEGAKANRHSYPGMVIDEFTTLSEWIYRSISGPGSSMKFDEISEMKALLSWTVEQFQETDRGLIIIGHTRRERRYGEIESEKNSPNYGEIKYDSGISLPIGTLPPLLIRELDFVWELVAEDDPDDPTSGIGERYFLTQPGRHALRKSRFFDIDPKLVIDKKRGLREILIENQVNIT